MDELAGIDDETAITVADARMASSGLPISPVRPGVVLRPAPGVVEVVFSGNQALVERGFTGVYRVFLGSFNDPIGAIRNDGTSMAHPPRVESSAEDDPVEVAKRFIEACGLPTAPLIPTLVKPARLLSVYYAPDRDDVMGGDYTVHMNESGVVVATERGQ